jgi:hypothetical protein
LDQLTISTEDLLDYKSATENEATFFTQASSDSRFVVSSEVGESFQSHAITKHLETGLWRTDTDTHHSTLDAKPALTYGAFAQPAIPASYDMPTGHHGS